MNDSHVEPSFRISTKVQICGILLKKSFIHLNKWSKRFFVVKESFLLYYGENEKKNFEKRGQFNVHPKAAIPIGGCAIESRSEGSQEYVIQIASDSFVNGPLIIAAETKFDQERWIRGLQEAARITLDNCCMEEAIIRDLETRGMQLNKEKQGYVEKLHEETIALRDEIDKNVELERLNSMLDQERKRLEAAIIEFQREHQAMKRDYEETIEAMKLVQQDKEALESTTKTLLNDLSALQKEKYIVMDMLKDAKDENGRLSKTASKLKDHLKGIEEETKTLLEEKHEIEERYQENERRAKVLEEEKEIISEQSTQLLSSLNDLIAQKDVPENELRLEVSARLEVERRLQLAQDSVEHLEGALENDIASQSLRTKILPDVKKLKKFFEQIAQESRIDADMPIIMKNAVYARKTLAKKARSQKLEQSRLEKAKTLGLDVELDTSGNSPLTRSLSFMISKKSLKPNLTRSRSSRLSNGSADDGS